MLPTEPFTKWGIDYISLIKSTWRYIGNRYVMVATDYVTKWGVKALQTNTANSDNTIPLWIYLNMIQLPTHVS
jgi:hypothetical protein